MMRILIADDHSIVRRGLKQILIEEFTDAFIGEVNDGIELLSLARSGQWDIIISDLTMPGVNGLEALKQLKVEFPDVPVLILSMHPEDQYAIRTLRAGASGYLSKESASDELLIAVNKIMSGKRYITPTLAEKLADVLEGNPDRQLHETLSDRELEVFKLIANGKTITEIASILLISVTTVSTYRARILVKTQMQTSAELTRYAIQNNIV
jgi:two-component system invasion response regulator UvrY